MALIFIYFEFLYFSTDQLGQVRLKVGAAQAKFNRGKNSSATGALFTKTSGSSHLILRDEIKFPVNSHQPAIAAAAVLNRCAAVEGIPDKPA